MKLLDVQIKIHNEALALRQFDRLIQSDLFADAFKNINAEEELDLKDIISSKDFFSLKKWIKRILRNNLDSLNYRELRALAAKEQVKGYSQLDKAHLLLVLKGIQDESGTDLEND